MKTLNFNINEFIEFCNNRNFMIFDKYKNNSFKDSYEFVRICFKNLSDENLLNASILLSNFQSFNKPYCSRSVRLEINQVVNG